jgi:hypothetical protein
MRKIETTVYSFAELSGKVQQNVLDILYDINISDEFWYESILDEFVEILHIIGFDTRSKDIQFCGFGSQGAGLSFTGHYSYAKNSLHKIIAEFPTWVDLHSSIKDLQAIQRRNFYRIEGDLYRYSHHYCHEQTVKFDCDRYSASFSVELDNDMTEIFRSIMQEFYSKLSEEYDYLSSEESIIETIKASNYEFYIDGNII